MEDKDIWNTKYLLEKEVDTDFKHFDKQTLGQTLSKVYAEARTQNKYEFVHNELAQVFYDIKWISSGAFEFEKKTLNTKN